MARVAVAPGTRFRAYDGVAAWTSFAAAFEVLDLEVALSRSYFSDAHLVTYVLPNCKRQPRMRKCSLPHLETLPVVDVFFCDVDNAAHQSWTDALVEQALYRYATLDVLQTAGVYHTAHGARIVQPIAEPIPVDRVEPYIANWLSQLEQAGIAVDWTCRDWTHLFRLPSVRRDRACRTAPFMDLSRMRPIELAQLPAESLAVQPHRSKPSPRPPGSPVEWRREISADWRDRVQAIANAVLAESSNWHALFLALSGALLSEGVEPGELPALIRAISVATGADSRTEDRVTAARTTVDNHRADNPIAGYGSLRTRWPGVAEALDRAIATSSPSEDSWDAQPAGALPLPSLLGDVDLLAPSGPADIDTAIRQASDGLTLIAAECGMGKTVAATRVAAERANKAYASEHAKGLRAPPQSKTAISVDKNVLAIQVVDDLFAAGVVAKRIFGPLSLRDAEGKRVCQLYEVAAPLVAGGQAMQWDLCQGRGIEACEHFNGCLAKDGCEGPHNARVTVGTHALIGALDGAAGSSGLLIIDEPQTLLETVIITTAQMESTDQVRHAFDPKYVSAITPAFRALRAWVAQATSDESKLLTEAITAGTPHVPQGCIDIARNATGCDGDFVELARAAKLDEHNRKAPPISWMHLQTARTSVAYSKTLGMASRVLGALYQGLTSDPPAAVRVKVAEGERVALLIYPREQLAKALCRQGSVVAMDANIEINADVYAKLVGYTPPLFRFPAGDGAPIERTLLFTHGATRKQWLPGGRLSLDDNNLATALRSALEAAQPAQKIGIITMLTVELAFRLALDPENTTVLGEWVDDGQAAKLLPKIREQLGPALRAFKGEIQFAHYGAVRGLNNMKDVDALITLGDPWPNLDAVRNEVAFLQLDNADAKIVARCQAELEQAHGRLRPVHRARPGKAVHVGSVRPSGTGWQHGVVRVKDLPTGRHKTDAAMTTEEFNKAVKSIGGVRAVAKALGCSHVAITRYASGERAVPVEVASRLAETA